MKIRTDKALEPVIDARSALYRIAWAAEERDPDLHEAASGVLGELQAAETQISLLLLEAACKAASLATQGILPLVQKPFLATVEEEDETIVIKSKPFPGVIVEEERDGVIYGVFSNG